MLLEIKDLGAEIEVDSRSLPVLSSVSVQVGAGETLGVVGESGSGKTVLSQSILRLNPEPPFSYRFGSIRFQGLELLDAEDQELRKIRGNEIAMVFQDPGTSMNPVMPIGAQIMEAIRAHKKTSKRKARSRATEVLTDVGIPDAEARLSSYPHQFSGGMKQRAMIAMAIACEPRLLIADEPTTALDVTTEDQILELLARLREQLGMAMIMVSHDLAIVRRVADQVVVMYGGRIVESGATEVVLDNPLMPYTWNLLRCVPRGDGLRLNPIQGAPPRLHDLPMGCAFHPRCPFVLPGCAAAIPPLDEKELSHRSACILTQEEFRRRRREQNVALRPPSRKRDVGSTSPDA